MKVKINHTLFITLSLITLLIAGNYWGIAQFVLPYKARRYILVLSGAIPLLLPLYYKKRSIIIPWMLCFFFVLFRNQEFLSGGYYNSIRLIGAYLFIFASVKSCDWIKKAPQIITAVGIANVIATLLFFVNNGLYQLFINTTYKQYQDGTQDGLYGYRAALADHYSQNGTYITIVLLTVWAVFLTLNGHEKKRKYIMIAGIANLKYSAAYNQILILMYAMLFRVLVGLYSCVYVAQKNAKKIAYTSISAAIINIAVDLILINKIQVFAASLSTLIALTIFLIVFSATSLLERFALVSLNVNSARDHYISTTLLAITVFLFTLQCHGSNKTLALIGRKYSTWLYILHPIFITCIGMVAHKVGVYGIYKFIAPIVVYITTLIFLMIVDKIKMAAVIDR